MIDGTDGVVNVEDATIEHPMQMQSPFHGGSFIRHHDHPFFRAICESRALLLEEIRGVLTPKQLAVWDEWIAGLPEYCFEPSAS